MVEKVVFQELSNKYSQLEQHCISLEIATQQSQEIFQNNRNCQNQDVLEFKEFFAINNLKAQLQEKDTTISNLKKHIADLEEKSVVDCSKSMNNSRVIAHGMYKIDLHPLPSILKKNKEVHEDYLKITKEHSDTLCGIVKSSKSSSGTWTQNDDVERRNRTLVEVKRHNKTPYELLHDRKPDLKYLHAFGDLCCPTNNNEDIGKLKPKAYIDIFIGYAPAKKAYRIYNRQTRQIMETIHVDFDKLKAMASE
ncbi:retrovirus-related pol polyprotein from transposon TNT 1-94 [Tanacetum coccineum]